MYCLVRKTSRVDELKELGVTLVEGDVTDKESLLKGMKGCQWVVNLANIYSFWEPDKNRYSQVNINGTRNVMESALENGISKIMHVSSLVIWGKPIACPFNEDTPVGPIRFSEYARTKYAGDLIAWEFYEKRKLPLVMLYLGAVLGPGDPKATGQYFKNYIDGKIPARMFVNSVMTYVHVKDVAEAIVKALEQENNTGEKYLIGKYRETFGNITKMLSEVSNVPLPKMALPPSVTMVMASLVTCMANISKKPPWLGMSIDQMRTMKEGSQFDGSKSEEELGITYTPIRTAIEEAIASYRK
jgi:dihydroflavonol-4-reductase